MHLPATESQLNLKRPTIAVHRERSAPSIEAFAEQLKIPHPQKHIRLEFREPKIYTTVDHPAIKDPCITKIGESRYVMYASIGSSDTERWIVGRFYATSPVGPWFEDKPAEIIGVEGPEVCAPAVTYDSEREIYEMYVQTCCFGVDGVIVHAVSEDGKTFLPRGTNLVNKQSVKFPITPLQGVYDVGISDMTIDHEEYVCLTYTGIRKVGCGDLYYRLGKKLSDRTMQWSDDRLLLSQDATSFASVHNAPGSIDFEWGLEGAKVVQLGDVFMIVGVCFLPSEPPHNTRARGTRQRIFMALADTIDGPYTFWDLPIQPEHGEVGHPDIILDKDSLYLVYQERYGDRDENGRSYPWYLCAARYELVDFINRAEMKQTSFSTSTTFTSPAPFSHQSVAA